MKLELLCRHGITRGHEWITVYLWFKGVLFIYYESTKRKLKTKIYQVSRHLTHTPKKIAALAPTPPSPSLLHTHKHTHTGDRRDSTADWIFFPLEKTQTMRNRNAPSTQFQHSPVVMNLDYACRDSVRSTYLSASAP